MDLNRDNGIIILMWRGFCRIVFSGNTKLEQTSHPESISTTGLLIVHAGDFSAGQSEALALPHRGAQQEHPGAGAQTSPCPLGTASPTGTVCFTASFIFQICPPTKDLKNNGATDKIFGSDILESSCISGFSVFFDPLVGGHQGAGALATPTSQDRQGADEKTGKLHTSHGLQFSQIFSDFHHLDFVKTF